MKATLERTDLLKSLTHVHRVVERRNTIPILSNVLLRADGGAINLKATDLDLEIVESVPAMIEMPGATTVPAHMFYDIVRKLPEGSQVVLETTSDNATLEIRAGRSKFTLQMLPETDFPDLTAGDFSHSFSLTGADIRKLIDATQFAISTEETRYYLNGIYLHTVDAGSGPQFRAVATDGHRLAQAEVPAPSGSAGMPGCTLYVQLNGFILDAPTKATDPFGMIRWLSPPVPTEPALAGASIGMQFVIGSLGTNMPGLVSSNGVELILGY